MTPRAYLGGAIDSRFGGWRLSSRLGGAGRRSGQSGVRGGESSPPGMIGMLLGSLGGFDFSVSAIPNTVMLSVSSSDPASGEGF